MIRKYLSLLLMLLLPAFAYSQAKLGVKAGTNLSVLYAQPDYQYYADRGTALEFGLIAQPGYFIGADLKIPIRNGFSISPGLQMARRRFTHQIKTQREGRSLQGFNRYDMAYLDVPLRFSWQQQLEKHTIHVYAGPYVSMGLLGYFNQQVTGSVNGVVGQGTEGHSVIFGTGEGHLFLDPSSVFKRSDAGLDVGLGLGYQALLTHT
jgi:hypothetical protein